MPWYIAKDAAGNEAGRFYATDSADAAANTPPGGSYALATAMQVGVNPAAAPAETAAQALARMLDTIDDEREGLQMRAMTTGGAKKWCYAEKAREYSDYAAQSASVLATLLNTVNMAATRARWPMAFAEVDETGDTLAVVMARWKAAIGNAATANAQRVRVIEARALKLKAQIRAATASGRPAIFNARTWPS